MDRKTFLKYSGIVGLGTVICSVKPISETVRFNGRLFKVSKTRGLMGTYTTITLMHPSRDQAEEAIELCFAEMERVSRLLNRYNSSSAVSVLNRDGHLNDLPPELATVLQRSSHYHDLSQGRFDITVAPLLDLYKHSFDAMGIPPGEKAIEEALHRVDGQAVVQDGRRVQFTKDGIHVTLDGIAKGYVVDCGAACLQELGIEHGLISAGGDIRAIGGKNKKSPWRVAVQKPGQTGFIEQLPLSNGAVATSGNYEVYYDSEKLYHHIVSPLSGTSPNAMSSASVKAASVMDADALSTTVFVMGPEKGRTFIETMPGTECLILNHAGAKFPSSNWKSI